MDKRPHVLLLTSPLPKEGLAYGIRFSEGKLEKRFPLGIGYLISILRENNIKVDFVDLMVKNVEIDFSKFDFIGVYANSLFFKGGTVPLLKSIKDSGFKGKIIIGGPHASLMPDTIPEFVDFIVQGEGEYTLLDIVSGKAKERIIKSDRINDLDALPMPAYDAFDLSLYNLKVEEFDDKRNVFIYSSSRGCPFNCSFCSVNRVIGKEWFAHSPERVLKDILYLKEKFGVDGIFFREDNFTVDMDRVRKICKLFIENNVGIVWKCESRADISYEDLKLMRDAGLKSIYFGFESGSERLLKIFNKNISVERYKKTIESCKRLCIEVFGSFLYNTPYETKEDVAATERFIKETGLRYSFISRYLGLPGSQIYDYIVKNPNVAEDKGIFVIK